MSSLEVRYLQLKCRGYCHLGGVRGKADGAQQTVPAELPGASASSDKRQSTKNQMIS